jgi:DNA-directed DNA polymerase III PolC
MSKFTESFSKIDLTNQFAGVQLPELTVDDDFRKQIGAVNADSNEELFKTVIRAGLKDKLKKGIIPKARLQEYVDRIKTELEVITKLHFTDYFLILWDFIKFCKQSDIPVGKGRGSAAGSLILFLLDITGIDPIKYDLLFERFISPSRSKSLEIDGKLYLTGSLPDVDVDLCYLRRHEVVEYLDKKYPKKTAKILNVATLTGKNVIKECGKGVYGKSETEMKHVSEMVPVVFGKVHDIARVYKENPKFKEWCDQYPLAYDIALHLRDLISHKSVHASGLVICKDEVTKLCPVELTADGQLVCSFNMNDSAEFMIKFDLLGLKTLTMVSEICKLVGEKFDDIDFEQPEIYHYLSHVNYFYGLFQLEGNTAYKATKLIQPDNILQLGDIMALGRPGGMDSIKEYKEYKAKGEVKKIHPLIDDILEPTYGFLIYQEQMMKVINRLGFSLEEGYVVVKIIGKKDKDKVGPWEAKIREAGKNKGLPEDVINLIWKTLNAAADYSFNKSHAICYGALAAVTTYLKANYNKEFFLGALKMSKYKKPGAVAQIVAEMPNFKIPLLPPDFSSANEDFQIEKEGIRFGLSSIQGISEAALGKLKHFKFSGNNKFEMFEAAKQAKVGIGILSSLIQAGALHGFNEPRTRLVLEAQLWNLLKPREKEYCLENGEKYNYNLVKMIKDINNWTTELSTQVSECEEQMLLGMDTGKKGKKGKKEPKPFVRSTRLETIIKHYAPYKKIYEQNSKHEDLTAWYYERSLLGFSYSTTLKDIFKKACPELLSTKDFPDMPERAVGTFVGIVDEIKSAKAKNNKMYSRITMSDEHGQLTFWLWEPDRTRLMETKILPKEGEICAFKGRKSGDGIALQDYSPQSNKIYMQMSEVKEEES